MDIVRLYQDYSVDFLTEGHKHTRPGWANVPCPFCTGNAGYHLGYNVQDDYYYCWRCGWHPTVETVAELIHKDRREAREIVRRYGLLVSPSAFKDTQVQPRAKSHRLPSLTFPLERAHKAYLEGRGFDAEKIEREWLLMGTGPLSTLDGINYRLRIIAPIIWNGRQVSFQGRDITEKHLLRYIACPKDREIIHHKNILYGKEEEWGETGICTEGITDVWRLGVKAFATFGIKYTHAQVREMAKRFKRIAVIFDDDPQAVVQAKQLVADLKFRGVDAWRVPIVGDPGGMPQKEANDIVREIVKK